jgi:surface antigen
MQPCDTPYHEVNEMKKLTLAAVATLTLLAGCAQQAGGGYGASPTLPAINKETIGTVIGGAGGAWAGSNVGKGSGKIVASVAGGLLGAFLGNQIGQSLDATDRLQLERSAQNAFERGRSAQPVRWSNPDSGNYGEIVPQSAYQDPTSGRTCRRYSQTIYIQGSPQRANGTACRGYNGEWEIVSGGNA